VISPFVFIAPALAIPIGVLGISVFRDKRYREAVAEYCQMRGYQFEPRRPGAEQALADSFQLFGRGHNRRWGPTVSGQVGGRPFTAFEYTYVTGGGKNSQRHRLAMMLWDVPGTALPRFSLGPEGFFNRIAQRFGVQDFDFDEDEEFSRAYQLQGDDEAAVRKLFTAARRAFLLAPGVDGSASERYHLAGTGTRLLWWRNGRLRVPDAFDQFIADGDRVRRLFMDDRG